MQSDGASAQRTMAGDEEKNSRRCKLTFSWQSQKYSTFKDRSEQRIEESGLVWCQKFFDRVFLRRGWMTHWSEFNVKLKSGTRTEFQVDARSSEIERMGVYGRD